MMKTLAEAKQELRNNFQKGMNCPCCGQFVKLYKRKLNKTMVYALTIIYKLHKEHGFDKYFKMNEEIAKMNIPSSNIEYAKLNYWGLLEEKENTDYSKKTSGYWRLTSTGIDFLENKIDVPTHVFIYNNKVQGFSKEKTFIQEALGNHFNYKELMSNK